MSSLTDTAPVRSTTPTLMGDRVFSFEKLHTHPLKVNETHSSPNELSDAQNLAVLLNFFMKRKTKAKQQSVMKILTKVAVRSKNIEKVRLKLDVLFRKKQIKDFRSLSIFQTKKMILISELSQMILKKQRKKCCFALMVLRLERDEKFCQIGESGSFLQPEQESSVSRMNKILLRMDLSSNQLDVSNLNDELKEKSFDQIESEYLCRLPARRMQMMSLDGNLDHM